MRLMTILDAEERMTKLVALAGAFALAAALQLGPVGLAWAQDNSDTGDDSGTVQDVGQSMPTGAPQSYTTPPAAPVRSKQRGTYRARCSVQPPKP